MPGSRHWEFRDPFLFESAIRSAEIDISIRNAGTYRAELTRIDFNRLWMQRGCENLARVAHAAVIPSRAPIMFLSDSDQLSMHHSGMELSTDEIVVYSPSAVHHHRTTGSTRWGALSLTPEDLSAVSTAIAGYEMEMPATTKRVRPKPAHFARLRSLHQAAGQIAKDTPDRFANGEAVRALENSLVHAMINCLTDSDQIEMSSGCRNRLAIVSRLEEFLRANPDRPLYLAEVCSAIGASERTLRVACNEHLGMGPINYLLLRRMHLVRRRLLASDPKQTSVTQVAINHGFWELGRFSVAYRRLFGEIPSASLRRSADWALSPPDSESA